MILGSDFAPRLGQKFDFTVKVLMILNSFYHHNFKIKIDGCKNITFYCILCAEQDLSLQKFAKS